MARCNHKRVSVHIGFLGDEQFNVNRRQVRLRGRNERYICDNCFSVTCTALLNARPRIKHSC